MRSKSLKLKLDQIYTYHFFDHGQINADRLNEQEDSQTLHHPEEKRSGEEETRFG